MNKKTKQRLKNRARKAREKAYVPYSKFPIGCAVLTEDGKIFSGCNIENASYGLTNCAERTAIYKAVSEGFNKFTALLLIADTGEPITPCGSCRQVICEFGRDIEVIMTNYHGDEIVMKSGELLPRSFDGGDIEHGV